jgi:hypothetical protein
LFTVGYAKQQVAMGRSLIQLGLKGRVQGVGARGEGVEETILLDGVCSEVAGPLHDFDYYNSFKLS